MLSRAVHVSICLMQACYVADAHLLVIVADGDCCCIGKYIAEASGLMLIPETQNIVKELLRPVHIACFGKLLQ